jgi:hypothetical protein
MESPGTGARLLLFFLAACFFFVLSSSFVLPIEEG